MWAIDAMNYTGEIPASREGRVPVQGTAKQLDAIRLALSQPVVEQFRVEVRAGLCFVNAEWSLFAKPFPGAPASSSETETVAQQT